MHRLSTLLPVQARLIASVLAALGLSLLAAWSGFGGAKAWLDAPCASWDSAAAAAVADLMADRSLERRLDDAVLHLRRARTYCHYGLVGLAQFDYQALLDSHLDGHEAGSRLSHEIGAAARGSGQR